MKLNKFVATTVSTIAFNVSLFAGVSGVHWGYYGAINPEHWAELDPEFFMCREGKNQSPVNIEKKNIITTKGLEKINFHYQTDAKDVLNNGHTIKVDIKDGSYIKVDGIKFELKQFHFHTPSENQIDGKNFPLEAHFVHLSKDGELAVVSVMFDIGKDNDVISKIWDKVSKKAGIERSCALSAEAINSLLPENKRYYRFDGSLTTPPCSEGVRWFVMQDYGEVSRGQIVEFEKMMHGHDNRPIQPMNARKVLK